MMPQKARYSEQLLREQVNHLFEQSHIASLGAIAVSTVTGIILWPLVAHVNLVIWVSAAVSITLLRHFFILRYQRIEVFEKNTLWWKKLFICLIFLSGVIWGSAALLIFPESSFPHQVFLSFILVGMVSGAIGTFSAVLPAFLAYAVPALLPLIIVFLNTGTLIQQSMGGMVLLYLSLGSVSAYHLFNKTRATLTLQFENIDLIHFLEQEKHRADAINDSLKEEVAERKRIEKILKKHRKNLEAMVDERTNALEKSNIDLKAEITERKHLEKQLFQAQKMEAIGIMAAGIAHDFNNILSGIQGNASLALLNMDPTHALYKKLRDIESYSASGTELTCQLLDLARSNTGNREPININQLINDTATMFSRTRKELRLHTSYKNKNKVTEADSGRIRQAIINLLVNAWQAMPNGGDIEITMEDVSIEDLNNMPFEMAPGGYIKISISDSGPGMEPSLISKIFDPFFTTKKRGKGTGLGLSSVYGIVNSHGGHIQVDSQPGQGSTFHIYLPASQKPVKSSLPSDNDAIATGTETILIIDDEPDIIEIATEMLEVLGYKVYSAPNGNQAIELYSKFQDRIHLIILDMVMPGMNGEQVYEQLIRINPKVKALLSSGYSQGGAAERILKKGGLGFIQKPFKIQLLSQSIRKALNTMDT